VPRELNDFTPFGYLRNPSHWARAWGETYGGNLRTAADGGRLGVEWAYPVGRDATSRCGLAISSPPNNLVCRHHTSELLAYEWGPHTAEFFLADDNTLCVRHTPSVQLVRYEEGTPPQPHHRVQPSSTFTCLTRKTDGVALPELEAAYARTLAEDKHFLAATPRLEGDWPAYWPEGLHHDFQTTRLLIQPAGGIFGDVWPAWMAAWPRVVFAEGTLDMLRLAYVDPTLARRAVATLLRDAPQPNIPCVFKNGEYNMVAADGSRCGTSPAWCLPFLNLQLLYLQTLDRDWLAEIYPRAAAYLEWWLINRTDAEGWVVYKCTWESGEDGNPRLDPSGSGDADIAKRVRPVELQATLAHAAGVLAFFAKELGRDAERWRALETSFRARTAKLFDPEVGRYRDWLIAEDRLQQDCPERPYWGVDPCRSSAQSLTPLLIGLPLDQQEVARHANPPWTLWPSWTWSVVESAAAAGLYAPIGELAFNTIDRVYRVTTRRSLADLQRPLPGCSPEYWPEDWHTYGGSDAYGWGATTANLLIRHLFGIKESLEASGWAVDLTPAFPQHMLREGARYTVANVPYRGRRFDLTYVVVEDALHATLETAAGERWQARLQVGQRARARLA